MKRLELNKLSRISKMMASDTIKGSGDINLKAAKDVIIKEREILENQYRVRRNQRYCS